ncbi:MAG: hypothetical protein AB7O59_21435 [Pirellulales bacterium]
MLEGLIVLVIGLVIVATVGHGLWVAAAWMLRNSSPSEPSAAWRKQQHSHCPRCGLPLAAHKCPACGWPGSFHVDRRPAAALDALAQQIERLQSTGVIQSDTSARLLLAIATERTALAAPGDAAQGAAVVQPVPPAVVPEPSFVANPDVVAAEVVEEAATPIATQPTPSFSARASTEPLPPRERLFAGAASSAGHAAPPPATRAHDPLFGDDPPAASKPAAPAAPPRRAWTDWLAAFMEERNIRWGELVGGLLIVCGSIALVVSFWAQIAERPLLKFLLFNGVTAGLFGVGFYSEHRWRLRTTSQGLLTIGCLLVPLNFMAIAAFTTAAAADHPLTIGGEILSVALFSTLVFLAGRILVGKNALPLVAAVILPSLAQLLVRRFAVPPLPWSTLWALAALPLAAYGGTNGWALWRDSRRATFGEDEVNALFKFLGIASFAVVLPLALLLVKSEQPLPTLRELSAAISLLAAVPLASGLLVWRRLAEGGLTALRTAGTSIAVFGAGLSLAGLVVGWPDPATMLPVALIEFVVFTWVAWRYRLPAAHLIAAACLAIGYVLVVYLFDAQIGWREQSPQLLAKAIVSGGTGVLLLPLVLGYAAAAFVALRRFGRAATLLESTPRVLALAAGALAVVSIALVTWFGFGVEGDPFGAAWVYLVYAALTLAYAARDRRAAISWIGAILLLAAVLQGVVQRYGAFFNLAHPPLTALLAYATLCALLALGMRKVRLAVEHSPLAGVLLIAGFGGSVAAAAWLASLVPTMVPGAGAGYWLWLAAVWLAIAAGTAWLPAYTLAQVAVALAVVFGVGHLLSVRAWFAETRWPWLDPWTLQAVGTALAGLSLMWAAKRALVRAWARKRPEDTRAARLESLLTSPWLSVDRCTTALLVALVVALGTYAALPGARQELSSGTARAVVSTAANEKTGAAAPATTASVPASEAFALPDIDHRHAGDLGCWALLAAVLVAVAASAWQQPSAAWLGGLALVTVAACPLVASRFAGDVAVASAWRFASVAWLAGASAVVWLRRPVGRYARAWGWPTSVLPNDFAWQMAALVFALGLAAPVAILAKIGLSALASSPGIVDWPGGWVGRAALCGIAAVVAGATGTLTGPRGLRGSLEQKAIWPTVFAAMALVVGLAPIVGAAIHHLAAALVAQPILGPEPGTLFDRLGPAASYAIPLCLVGLVLVGYALAQRSAGFAFAGGLVTNAAATLAFLLARSTTGLVFDGPLWVRLTQLNAVVAAVYCLGWMAVRHLLARRRGDVVPLGVELPLAAQVALAPGLITLLLGWAWCDVFLYPRGNAGQPRVMSGELVDAWGWLSVTLSAAVAAVLAGPAGRRVSMAALGALLTALAVMAAAVAGAWDVGNWLAYHTLAVGHMVIAVVVLAIAWRERRTVATNAGVTSAATSYGADTLRAADLPAQLRAVSAWLTGAGNAVWSVLARAVVLVLAVRELPDDFNWPLAGLIVLAVTGAAAAWIFQRRRYLYDAALMTNLAGSIAWIKFSVVPGLTNFVLANVVLLAAPVIAWLAIERASIARRSFVSSWNVPPVHRVATRLSILALAVLAGIGLYADARQLAPMAAAHWLSWTALAVTALAVTALAALACLYEGPVRDAIARLYVLGLVAVAMLVNVFDLPPQWLLWTGNMVLAAYVLATSYLWSCRRGLSAWAKRFRISVAADHELAGLAWLVPCNLLLVALVVTLTGLVELTQLDVSLRVLASQAVLAQVVSVALIARGDRRGVLQETSLALGALGAVLFAWAWIVPSAPGALLHTLVVTSAALAAVAAFYGLGLGKLLRDGSDWLAPARRTTPWLFGATVAGLAATLSTEVFEFAQVGTVAIAWPAILAVALTLGGLALAALAAALLPGRDPLSLSERGRTLYVYGAEVLLALLFVHLRLTMPWLFAGFFQQFWPLIVMAIAFAGVGFAELCRRYRQPVLAEPLENTGALLPVLPVLGFWFAQSQVDYSLLLVAVGVLYAGLSIARRSFGFGVLAAVAANGGLWYFLNRQDGWGFLAHPQIWIIPPAVCVLVAAYLNRSQLSDAQMTAVRYSSTMCIYVSSTADIFVIGVAQNPWLPLVLAGLSILGILAGIALRVRAFLLLGTSFLGLALFTMIWHAAVDLDQTWIWFVSVVVAGVLIFVMFAIFEKKRREVLEAFERIKHWEA